MTTQARSALKPPGASNATPPSRNPVVPGRAYLVATSMLATFIATYFAIVSPNPLPDHPWLYGENDLTLHVVAFFAVAVPSFCAFRRAWAVVVTIAGLAVILEIMQLFIPGRTASLNDIVAGLVGLLLAYGCVLAARWAGRRLQILKWDTPSWWPKHKR